MPTLCKCDLSVIVPVYNLERYIIPLLFSLKSQKVGDYKVEYIFVLNNCTDKSEEVIKGSGLNCSILNCELQGCGCARNVGLDVAQGEYIWFLDGDDWLTSDTALRDVLDFAKSENYNIIRIPYKSETYRNYYFSMVWQYLFRRDLIGETRFRRIQPGEDDEFTATMLERIGLRREYFLLLPTVDKPLYYYNFMREGSNMFRYYKGENINE